jgi:hypothetical protein
MPIHQLYKRDWFFWIGEVGIYFKSVDFKGIMCGNSGLEELSGNMSYVWIYWASVQAKDHGKEDKMIKMDEKTKCSQLRVENGRAASLFPYEREILSQWVEKVTPHMYIV